MEHDWYDAVKNGMSLSQAIEAFGLSRTDYFLIRNWVFCWEASKFLTNREIGLKYKTDRTTLPAKLKKKGFKLNPFRVRPFLLLPSLQATAKAVCKKGRYQGSIDTSRHQG